MLSAVIASAFALPALGQVQRSIPTSTYFNHFSLLYAGEYRDALKGFGSERGIRTPQSRWIDSICYQTMTGESYYKLGQYGEALDSYTAALNLYVAYANWMVSVQFPPNISPVANRPALPWGRSARGAKLGRFTPMLISQGQPITEAAIRKGGVISSPVLQSIDVAEIVRCTCLAMMRRAELLGPLAKHDPLTDKILAAAQQRQGVPNHWSGAWLDAQLGFAYVAAGNSGQAAGLLQQSLLVGGEMDHPVTPMALLQLGKISLDAGKLAEAARFFEEASYSAAEQDQLTVLEEAFRYGAIAHAISRPKNVMAALEPAALWASKKGGRELQASLLILAAESAADIGQTKQSAQLLAQARTIVGRRIMSACEVGARLNYITALAQYQGGNVAMGDDALAAALKIYKGFSPWLFQLGLTSSELIKGNLSSRNARTIFERLADDPTPADWVARPMDCMTVLSTPHHTVFEQWFDTVSERDMDTALEVAERARRHRFYSALPFGGRLLALRWLLEGPESALDNETQLQRQDLLARYPAYVEFGKRAETLRTQLLQMPLVTEKDTSDQYRKQSELFDELAKATASRELILRQIAVRREPANFVFPPIRKMKDVQAALPAGTVLLSVFSANKQLHAVLLSKDKYANWKVERPDLLEKKIVALLRAMGNYDAQREIPQTQFADKSWEAISRELIDSFLKGSRLNFAQKFDELVVVPDGDIWYLPFEAVHVGDGRNTIPLLVKTRVRYAPTIGLAFGGRTGRTESPRTGIVLGKATAREDAQDTDTFVVRLKSALAKTTVLPNTAMAPSPYYGALLDGIVVLDDLGNNPPSPLDWSPLPIDRQKQAGSLFNWLALPWKSTDFLAFSGFHTPCENGLKDGGAHGQDLFLASCGLMATGTRTVLLSRWRTGGQSSRELVRQFVQELPFSTAAESWQRAVRLVKESPLDVAYEPRIRAAANAPVINGAHPFFWAGFMVFDSGVSPHTDEAAPAEPPVPKLDAKAGNDTADAAGDKTGAVDGDANGIGDDAPKEPARAVKSRN